MIVQSVPIAVNLNRNYYYLKRMQGQSSAI